MSETKTSISISFYMISQVALFLFYYGCDVWMPWYILWFPTLIACVPLVIASVILVILGVDSVFDR